MHTTMANQNVHGCVMRIIINQVTHVKYVQLVQPVPLALPRQRNVNANKTNT